MFNVLLLCLVMFNVLLLCLVMFNVLLLCLVGSVRRQSDHLDRERRTGCSAGRCFVYIFYPSVSLLLEFLESCIL